MPAALAAQMAAPLVCISSTYVICASPPHKFWSDQGDFKLDSAGIVAFLGEVDPPPRWLALGHRHNVDPTAAHKVVAAECLVVPAADGKGQGLELRVAFKSRDSFTPRVGLGRP